MLAMLRLLKDSFVLVPAECVPQAHPSSVECPRYGAIPFVWSSETMGVGQQCRGECLPLGGILEEEGLQRRVLNVIRCVTEVPLAIPRRLSEVIQHPLLGLLGHKKLLLVTVIAMEVPLP